MSGSEFPVKPGDIGVVLDETDVPAVCELVRACRAAEARSAFPEPADVASLLAEPASLALSRGWREGDRLLAWCLVQEAFGNVLFDVHPDARSRLSERVLGTAMDVLSSTGSWTVDTPLESDDAWRTEVLRAAGFTDSGQDVVHLRLDDLPGPAPAVAVPAEVDVVSNAADLDAYVAAHRAAFGTEYLTRPRREAWSEEEGYDPDLDIGLVAHGRLAAFAVSYLRGTEGEIGTVGVVPEHRGRGWGGAAVRLALERLASRGAQVATMSTSSTNRHMLAVAAGCGFAEYRRTRWLHKEL